MTTQTKIRPVATPIHSANHWWKRDLVLIGLVVAGLMGMAGFLLSHPAHRAARQHAEQVENAPPDVSVAADSLKLSFQEYWNANQVQPTSEVDSLQLARRLGLALTGTIPSLQEIREFESLPADDRVDVWVRRLLQDPRSHDWLAERLARAFVGVEEGPFVLFRRRKFVDWLSDQVARNVPYDQTVTSLLADDGMWTDTPAVNFLTHTMDADAQIEGEPKMPDPIRLAGRTARAFLGVRLDCLQCHDDFLGTINLPSTDRPVGGQQIHFHQLAAFFSQAKLSLTGISDDADKGPYQYQLLDEDEAAAIASAVPFQPELLEATRPDLSQRQRLAAWVTHPKNTAFARATVNRLFAILMGRGLVQPVDDIPQVGQLPEPLEILAADFSAHQFDLHRLIRLIAGSKAFRLASDRADGESMSTVDVESLAAFPATRLRPDQIARSVIQSTSLRSLDTQSHVMLQLIGFNQQQEFVRRYGDAGEDEFESRSETVTQRLLMLNGKMVQERLQAPFNSAAFLAGLSPDVSTAIETVFLVTLTRRPTNDEQSFFQGKLEQARTGEKRALTLQDLHWSLLNGVEFGWNH